MGGRPDGFVLAGGRSSRMGIDKARIARAGGVPMALEVMRSMERVCGRVALVRRGPPDGLGWGEGEDVEVIRDEDHDGVHPLFGVAAALGAARTSLVVIAPCDVPMVTECVWQQLLGEASVHGAVAVTRGQAHPLVAVYPAGWHERARRAALAGQSAQQFCGPCARVEVEHRLLRNINRPEDLQVEGPVRSLLQGLSWLDAADQERVARGEITRLAARGAVDPDSPVRYARGPQGRSHES